MSLAARFALLVIAVLLPAWFGCLAILAVGARDGFAEQLAVRNQEAAASLESTLRGLSLDGAKSLLATQAERGGYRRVALVDAGGAPVLEWAHSGGRSPRWFAALLPLAAAPGEAPLADRLQPATRLWVEADVGRAEQALWTLVLHAASWLALLTAAAAAVAAWVMRSWQRPLRAAVAQAQAIEQARFVTAEVPALPELRDVTRAMNSMVQRLRDLFDTQAEQVTQLQQQAQTDAVSGLPVRDQFMGRLNDLLSGPEGPAASLLLVRASGLERLNERHGRESTDRLLAALADVLMTYVERVPGTIAGRLNGTDFGLCLPVSGIAKETAESLREAIETTPAARLAGAEFLFGGCDGLRSIGAGAALAAADAALARAEAGEGIAIDEAPDAATGGSRTWREQIAEAIDQQRVKLGAYPVLDRSGKLIHLECPLRVQLQPGSEYQVARRWLALAARSRLLPQVDLAAVELALTAIAEDEQPRCVHVAPRSFAAGDFAELLQSRIVRAAASARRLSIEWTDGARAADTAALRTAALGWRKAGVTVGIEHAGASPKALAELAAIGVDYIKVDARHLRGLASDDAVKSYAASLVALIKSLDLRAYAEGIDDPRDLEALWALGFDGATGAAVKLAA